MTLIIETILDVGMKLFGLRAQLSKARQDRKALVADFLSALAQTIEDVTGSLRQGIYPGGKCQELLSHALRMEEAIGDLIGTQDAQDLSNKLREIWQIEQLYGELKSESDDKRESRLRLLDEAAGKFRAAAAVVRVSP